MFKGNLGASNVEKRKDSYFPFSVYLLIPSLATLYTALNDRARGE
jgi:hypothetical protein